MFNVFLLLHPRKFPEKNTPAKAPHHTSRTGNLYLVFFNIYLNSLTALQHLNNYLNAPTLQN